MSAADEYTAAVIAELRARWEVLRQRFPQFTPDTLEGFVRDVNRRSVYAKDWREDARVLLITAPELVREAA